tara:strand:- start:2188 stop:2469 length:282 start_codon:yes stop_codon:yes gene_type:complete
MSYPESPSKRTPQTTNRALNTYLSNSIVEYLEVPAQVKKALFMYGVRTLADLDFASDEEILEYHGVAQKNLLKIRAAADKLRHEINTGLESKG